MFFGGVYNYKATREVNWVAPSPFLFGEAWKDFEWRFLSAKLFVMFI